MGTEQEPDKVVPALNSDDQDAKRKRRFVRATEAFQRRAEASERRWLDGLRGGNPTGNGLRREGNGSPPCERTGELGENRQVGVEPHSLKSTDAKRQPVHS